MRESSIFVVLVCVAALGAVACGDDAGDGTGGTTGSGGASAASQSSAGGQNSASGQGGGPGGASGQSSGGPSTVVVPADTVPVPRRAFGEVSPA